MSKRKEFEYIYYNKGLHYNCYNDLSRFKRYYVASNLFKDNINLRCCYMLSKKEGNVLSFTKDKDIYHVLNIINNNTITANFGLKVFG